MFLTGQPESAATAEQGSRQDAAGLLGGMLNFVQSLSAK